MMKNKKIKKKIKKLNKIQRETVDALLDSFENGTVNIDRFIIWIKRNYECPGNSMFLKYWGYPKDEVKE